MNKYLTPPVFAIVVFTVSVFIAVYVAVLYQSIPQEYIDRQNAKYACVDAITEKAKYYQNIEWASGKRAVIWSYQDETFDVVMSFVGDYSDGSTVSAIAYCAVTKTDSGMKSMLPIISEQGF